MNFHKEVFRQMDKDNNVLFELSTLLGQSDYYKIMGIMKERQLTIKELLKESIEAWIKVNGRSLR